MGLYHLAFKLLVKKFCFDSKRALNHYNVYNTLTLYGPPVCDDVPDLLSYLSCLKKAMQI
jgi:hypothetical protein